ncbi:MAG: hypothetical protein AAGF45_11570 [Pseudomonadota bacterium]
MAHTPTQIAIREWHKAVAEFSLLPGSHVEVVISRILRAFSNVRPEDDFVMVPKGELLTVCKQALTDSEGLDYWAPYSGGAPQSVLEQRDRVKNLAAFAGGLPSA